MNATSRERAPDQGPVCFDEAQRPGDRNIPDEVAHDGDLFEHPIDQFRAITPANEELLEAWVKDASPSPGLRAWYAHDPEKWPEFRERYTAELEANPEGWRPLLERARAGTITLVYAAKDTERNSASVLKGVLERHLNDDDQ